MNSIVAKNNSSMKKIFFRCMCLPISLDNGDSVISLNSTEVSYWRAMTKLFYWNNKMLTVLTILCGRGHVHERNCECYVYRSMRRSRGRVREAQSCLWGKQREQDYDGDIVSTSSSVESLSFRNPKQKIYLASSIPWRLTLFGRTISIVRSLTHCILLSKQI